MTEKVLVIHGGAPTAVLNSSLYGILAEADQNLSAVGKVIAARGGSGGLLREDFFNLNLLTEKDRENLLYTPGTVIGTSRDQLGPGEYKRMAEIIKKNEISIVLYNGGNGSMDACGKLAQACEGTKVRVVGIPKTIDNDLAATDHAPGFGSAARYLAGTVGEIAVDIRSMPIHVCVIEAMGRNVGWLTAASCLADTGGVPVLACIPELGFCEDVFFSRVEELSQKHGGVIVVVSEGLKHEDKAPLVEPVLQVGRSVYYGDVGTHLANSIIKKLGIKARSEKPGIIGRSSSVWQSAVDRDEAVLAGKAALKVALEGQSGVMVAFRRRIGPQYEIKTVTVPIEEVMLHERALPAEFWNQDAFGATEAFRQWCMPLLGGPLPAYARSV